MPGSGRRWSAPVAVPADLSCPHGPTTGLVTLPHHLYWSGTGGPRTLDLSDPAERDLPYSIVLTEGRDDDVTTYLELGFWPTCGRPSGSLRMFARRGRRC